MSKPQTFAELLAFDPRYKREAYGFVFDALRYAHDTLGLGTETPTETIDAPEGVEATEGQRHLTGGELSDAIRRYALEQFGFMAMNVLESWGIRKTGDFGDIVFNLIEIGEMSKTKHDRREDFDDIYDFEEAFRRDFVIEPPKA